MAAHLVFHGRAAETRTSTSRGFTASREEGGESPRSLLLEPRHLTSGCEGYPMGEQGPRRGESVVDACGWTDGLSDGVPCIEGLPFACSFLNHVRRIPASREISRCCGAHRRSGSRSAATDTCQDSELARRSLAGAADCRIIARRAQSLLHLPHRWLTDFLRLALRRSVCSLLRCALCFASVH